MQMGTPSEEPSSTAIVPVSSTSNKSVTIKREESLKTLNGATAFQTRASSMSLGFVAAGLSGSKLFTNEGWKQMRTKRRTSADLAVDSLLNEVSVRPAAKDGAERRASLDSAEKIAEEGEESPPPEPSSVLQPREDTNDTIFAVEGSISPEYPLIRFLSPFAVFFDRLRIVLACWTLAYTPVMWAFDDSATGFIRSAASHSMEMIADIVFMGGILLSFITSVGSSTAGREFVTPKVIRRKRLTSVIVWCDILSCCPLLLGMFFGEVFNPTGFFRAWHLLKLLRIHWVLSMPASHFEMQFNTTVQVLRMLVWIALSTHLIGCLWYAVAFGNGVVGRHLEGIVDVSGVTHYLVALKQGVYMVTGKPVTPYCDDELLMIGITSPVGGIFFAFIYGNTTMLLTRINILMSKHHKQVALIRSTMRTLDIPHELRERIARYHHFLAVHHNINAYTSLMQGLSVNLFIELKAHLFRKMFSQGAFFRDAPGGFLRRLLQEMIEATFCPGDVVIRCGDLGDQMYFVVKGRLDVLSADGVNIGKISENQYFGEIALLISTPRLVSIRATTYCLLAMINRETFLPLLEMYPEQKKRMFECMKNYKTNQQDEPKEDTDAEGNNTDDSKEAANESEIEIIAESMRGLRTSGTAWTEKVPAEEKFPSEGHQQRGSHDGVESQLLSIPGSSPGRGKIPKRRKSAGASLTARRLSAISKNSSCSTKVVDLKEDSTPHARFSTGRADSKGDSPGKGDRDHSKGETEKKRKKSGFLSSLEKVWATPRSSVCANEFDHFAGALSRIPKPGPVRSGRPSIAMNVGYSVGAPATGTLLHASSTPHSAGQLLHESSKWSMVGDLVLDRTEELEHAVEVLLDDMETRIIEHVDDTFEAPIKEIMQEARAMREALNKNTEALQAVQSLLGASSARSPERGLSPGMIDT